VLPAMLDMNYCYRCQCHHVAHSVVCLLVILIQSGCHLRCVPMCMWANGTKY